MLLDKWAAATIQLLECMFCSASYAKKDLSEISQKNTPCKREHMARSSEGLLIPIKPTIRLV